MNAKHNTPRCPFIPAWLDDAQLPASDFRILAHLWRRADRAGTCFPAAPSIAKCCRLNVDTVWKSLARLQGKGYLSRGKHFRNSNLYRLTVPSQRITGNEGVIESPETRGWQSPEKEGGQSPGKEGRQSPETRGCKGSPVKDLHEGSPREGGEAPGVLFPWKKFQDIPAETLEYICAKANAEPGEVEDAFSAIRGRKLSFNDYRSIDEWPDIMVHEVVNCRIIASR